MYVLDLMQIYNESGEVVTLDLIERVRAEIERLQAIVEGAKLARSTWIVEWGWNGVEMGHGYFYRRRHSTSSTWSGTAIEDAWTAIYRQDKAFRSRVSCTEVVE